MIKKYLVVGSLFIGSFYSLYSQADRDGFFGFFGSGPGVEPVRNAVYLEECGSCHFAYQPGLLPSRSWIRMFSQKELTNHFEEDITFDDKALETQLLDYLTMHAAEKSSFKRSRKIMRSLPYNASPLRTSDTPYLRRKHGEIPKNLITQPDVGSIANCEACHRTATEGVYEEDQIRIPNAGFFNYDDD